MRVAVGRRIPSRPNWPTMSQTARFPRWQLPRRKTTSHKQRRLLPEFTEHTGRLRRPFLRICNLQGRGKRIRVRLHEGGVSNHQLPHVRRSVRRSCEVAPIPETIFHTQDNPPWVRQWQKRGREKEKPTPTASSQGNSEDEQNGQEGPCHRAQGYRPLG